MFDHSKGGDDSFIGGAFSVNTIYGDAGGNMSDHAQGGNDTFSDAGSSIGARHHHRQHCLR